MTQIFYVIRFISFQDNLFYNRENDNNQINLLKRGITMVSFERICNLHELEEIHQIKKRAFEQLYNKYQDVQSPFNEPLAALKEKYERPNNYYFKIKNKAEVVGYLRIVTNMAANEARISPIAIQPSDAGAGYGTQAMLLAEKTFPTIKKWHLSTIFQEEKLRHFYSKLGYEQIGAVEPIQAGMDLIYFTKNLKHEEKRKEN